MQTIHGAPILSRVTTGRAIRIMERVLSANDVSRARDLPEEARVRLYLQLVRFFEEERAAQWARQMHGNALQKCAWYLQEQWEGLRQTLRGG